MRQTLAWILGKGGSQADLPSCLVCEGEEDCRRDPMWNSDWGAKLPSYLAAAGYSERQCYTSMSQTVVGLFVKKRNGDHAHNCFFSDYPNNLKFWSVTYFKMSGMRL